MPMSKYTWLTLGGSTWYKSDLGTQEWKNALLSILGWGWGESWHCETMMWEIYEFKTSILHVNNGIKVRSVPG